MKDQFLTSGAFHPSHFVVTEGYVAAVCVGVAARGTVTEEISALEPLRPAHVARTMHTVIGTLAMFRLRFDAFANTSLKKRRK